MDNHNQKAIFKGDGSQLIARQLLAIIAGSFIVALVILISFFLIV